jgi:hypothetical protein
MSNHTYLQAPQTHSSNATPGKLSDGLHVVLSWTAEKKGGKCSERAAIDEHDIELVEGLSNPLAYHRPRGTGFSLACITRNFKKAGVLVFSPMDERSRELVIEAIDLVDQAWQCFVGPQVSMNQRRLSDSEVDGRKSADRAKVYAVDDRLVALAKAKERCIESCERSTIDWSSSIES